MTTYRTSAAVAAVVCPVLAALAAGCGGGTGAQSAGSAVSAAPVSSAPRPCQPDRPILYLGGAVRADGRHVKQAPTRGAGNTWSPDGSTQAYVSDDARRVILRTADGADRTLFVVPKGIGIVHRPAWSPDGSRLALILLDERGLSGGGLGSYQPHLVVIDAETGKPAADVLLSPAVVNMPYITNPPDTVAFSPDGKKVAVSWDSLAVVDVASGSVSRVWRSPAVASWSPGGRLLFLAVEGRARFGALYTWGPLVGTRLAMPGNAVASRGIAVQRGVEYGQLRLSPDGTRMAIRTASGAGTAIDVYRMDGGSLGSKVRSYPVDAQVWDMDWSPSGDCLAAVVLDGSALTVRTLDLGTGAWKTVAHLDITVDNTDTLDALGPVKKLSWSD